MISRMNFICYSVIIIISVSSMYQHIFPHNNICFEKSTDMWYFREHIYYYYHYYCFYHFFIFYFFFRSWRPNIHSAKYLDDFCHMILLFKMWKSWFNFMYFPQTKKYSDTYFTWKHKNCLFCLFYLIFPLGISAK